jgi:pimeloyl-ACP methyl ester carboxylesterase
MTDAAGGRAVHFPASGGIRLEAEVWGSDDGVPVLLAHGGGQSRLAWRETAVRLAGAGFFAVAVDLRGHGGSDRAADYSLTAFRDDIVSLAQRLGRPALVGASLGGQSSLLAEGETDGGVARALVLVDVAPTLEPDGVRRIMAFMERHLDGFASLDEAVEAVIAYQPHRPARPDAGGLRRYLREGTDRRLYWHWDPAFLRQARSHIDLVWERATAAARGVSVPTLLVRGGRSDVLGPAGVEELCRLIPHAEVRDIAEAHHMVAGDENDAFTATVLEFLRLKSGPPRRGRPRRVATP